MFVIRSSRLLLPLFGRLHMEIERSFRICRAADALVQNNPSCICANASLLSAALA
jgi:hypothetical protein